MPALVRRLPSLKSSVNKQWRKTRATCQAKAHRFQGRHRKICTDFLPIGTVNSDKEKEIGGVSYLKVLGRLALGLAVVGKPLSIPDLHTQTISHQSLNSIGVNESIRQYSDRRYCQIMNATA